VRPLVRRIAFGRTVNFSLGSVTIILNPICRRKRACRHDSPERSECPPFPLPRLLTEAVDVKSEDAEIEGNNF
jgi:hypothetical protein